MEVRPVEAVDGHQPAAGRRRHGRDLAASSLDVDLLRLGLDLALGVARGRASGRGSADEGLEGGLVVARGDGEVELGGAAEAAGDEGALGPAVGDAGEVPLNALRVGVAVELGVDVDEGLGSGDVEEVDGGEVEDDGAQDGAGRDLVAVGNLAAARAGVVPGAVL